MRIVQALGWYYPESLGGTEVYVSGLSRRLQAIGHEVLVAAPDAAFPQERQYDYEGVPVYRYPISDEPTRAEAQGMIPVRGSERFHRWLAAQRPDVVHVHSFVTGLGLAELKAAKATGARVIVTTHAASLGWICQRGTMMQWGEALCDGVCDPEKCAGCELQHRGLPKRLAQMVGAIPIALARAAQRLPGKAGTAISLRDLIVRNQARQRAMLDTVDKFVVLTAVAFDVVIRNNAPAKKIALNRLGADVANVMPKPGPDEQATKSPITVGYMGRFEALKGAHDLARAVASLAPDIPIRVEFRGPVVSRSEHACVGELQAVLGGDRRIAFAQPVPHVEALAILAGYDVLCCPSVCLEGGPTVAIEAHAVGTPVIGTRIGGLAELVTDGINGRLVAPGDWRHLTRVLEHVALKPSETIDRWRRAFPRVRTMDDVAADYLALYGT